MPLYEIRRAGLVLCTSSIPGCGYPKDILRDMERNGMHLYLNGKREKAALRGANTEDSRPK